MAQDDSLPAWSLDRDAAQQTRLHSPFPPDDAWRAGTGKGVRVCVIDSGVDGTHPRVAGIQGAVAFDADRNVIEDEEGDLFGHGTACAGIIRSLAPECEIYSVRTLGRDLTGRRRDTARRPRVGHRPAL